jgi:hypothetical protein
MRTLLGQLQALPTPPPRFYERWGERLLAWYLRIAQWPRLRRVVTVVFVIWAANAMLIVLGTVFEAGVRFGKLPPGFKAADYDGLSFLNLAITTCSLVSLCLVLVGLVRLRRDRLAAYRWFERALLVSILLTHVFVFVRSQFGAVFGLGLDILLLLVVRSMIHAEEGRPGALPTLIDRPAMGSPVRSPPLAAPGTPPP